MDSALTILGFVDGVLEHVARNAIFLFFIVRDIFKTIELETVLMIVAPLPFVTISIYWLSRWKKIKKIRAKTLVQKKLLKQALSDIKSIKSNKKNLSQCVQKMDGFGFELFVLETLRLAYKARRVDSIRLTGDNGMDGGLYVDDTYIIIQSKHYSGSVQTKDIEAIGQMARRFESSEHPYAIKKRKRFKYKYVKAIFATSGHITSTGYEAAERLGVQIVTLKCMENLLVNTK